MYNSQIVAERIKKAVKANNTTMDTLNTKCNLSKNAVSSASKSSEGMKAKNLYMIAEFLNVSVDYLLGRTDEPKGISIKAGDINGDNNSLTDSNNINISEQKKLDEMSAELLKKFSQLSFDEKIEVFNYIKNKEK